MHVRTAGYKRCTRGLLVLLVGLTFLAGSNQRGEAQSNTDELRRWISLGGGLFGAMIGAIPGAVAAPIVQINLPAGQ